MNNSLKNISLVSLGCPKNLVDSEVMLGILKQDGFNLTTKEADADIIIVNTCGFIEDAARESIDEILRLAEYKKNRCKLLIVSGCLTQRYKDELAKELPEVDYFIGTGEYHKIADIIKNRGNKRVIADKPIYIHDYSTPRILSTPKYSAYVKIAEGCSNDCSYCAIPSIRGKFRSRTVYSIVKEVEDLARKGVKEINLIAQDITSFGRDLKNSDTLEALLKKLVKIDRIEWIRLLYLYPGKITDTLIKLIRDEGKICKYIDIPLQHVSAGILKKMNRPAAKKEIKTLINKLRKEIPGVTLRTSLIAGFPGETEKEFNELLRFIKETKFDRLGVFKYSKEEGTLASKMKNQIPDSVKEKRFRRLMNAQKKISFKKNKTLVKTLVPAIIEGISEETDLLLKARAASQAPDVDGITLVTSGTAFPGDMVMLRITDAGEYDLIGEIVEPG